MVNFTVSLRRDSLTTGVNGSGVDTVTVGYTDVDAALPSHVVNAVEGISGDALAKKNHVDGVRRRRNPYLHVFIVTKGVVYFLRVVSIRVKVSDNAVRPVVRSTGG